MSDRNFSPSGSLSTGEGGGRGRNAIIMGATSGMGRGIALGLLAEGYVIGVCGRRKEALDEIKAIAPDRVFIKVIDVIKEEAPSLLMQLIEEMGGMDLYFHSSGYGKQNMDLALSIESQTVLTNSYGFTQMVVTAFNYFKTEKRSGRIAVISSVAGTKGLGAAPSYSATKRFDWTYIEALAQLAHMQKLDIKFTDIRPGFVATDFIAGDNYPMTMPTDYVVKHILKAVRKGKRKIIIDWKYRILCFFWRHIPSCIWERMHIK